MAAQYPPNILDGVTTDLVGKTIEIENMSAYAFDYQKTGVGTCTISFYRSMDGTNWSIIPDNVLVGGQTYDLATGVQNGQVDVLVNTGWKFTRVVITNAALAFEINCQMGGLRNN